MRYRADIVVKDLQSDNIGLLRSPIAPPRHKGELEVSSVILTDFIAQLREIPRQEEMFVIGDLKVRPNLKNEFFSTQPFGAYFQVYNVNLDQSTSNPDISVIYRIERDGRQVKYWSEDRGESVQFVSAQRLVVAKRLPLTNLPPAEYLLHIEITDNLSAKSVATKHRFKVKASIAAGD